VKENIVERIERIEEAMAARGISSGAQLARKCGIPGTTARTYLNRQRGPSKEACEKIGRGLEVSRDWLYYGTGAMNSLTEAEAVAVGATSDLIFAAVEELLLLMGLSPKAAQETAGEIQLIVHGHPRRPPGMSREEVVRRLVRIRLELSLLSPPKA
jgi:transcriptional regulator with XRE-family HTH domain